MKNGNFFIVMIMVVLTGSIMLVALFALEILVLILLGFTYDRWQSLLLFIVAFGILEYIASSVLQRMLKAKNSQHPNIHRFWGQTFISFILMMVFVRIMDSIWISTTGAILYALITAALYIIFDRKTKKAVD